MLGHFISWDSITSHQSLYLEYLHLSNKLRVVAIAGGIIGVWNMARLASVLLARRTFRMLSAGSLLWFFFQNRWPNCDEVWVFGDSIDQPATEARVESRILLRQRLKADDVFAG